MRRSAGFFILTLLLVFLGAFLGSVCAQPQDEYRRLKSIQFIGNKALTAAQLQSHLKFAKPGKWVVPEVVRPAGLEPATLCLEGRCSIHLSYGRTRTSDFVTAAVRLLDGSSKPQYIKLGRALTKGMKIPRAASTDSRL